MIFLELRLQSLAMCDSKSRVNFAFLFGGGGGGFFQAFFLGENRKNPPKIHGKTQIGIWEFRGQSPHCKNPALRDILRVVISPRTGHDEFG